jgi:hypothetical protein
MLSNRHGLPDNQQANEKQNETPFKHHVTYLPLQQM